MALFLAQKIKNRKENFIFLKIIVDFCVIKWL